MFAIWLITSGCSKEKTFDCIKSTGSIIKEDRYFSNFDRLQVEDNMSIILVQNMPGKIIIEAGENLTPKIETEQSGNTIYVRNNNTCNWVRSYDKPFNVYVGINQIGHISNYGHGSITSAASVTTDSLEIFNMGNGDADFTITADHIGFICDNLSSIKMSGYSKKIAGRCYKNSVVNTASLNTPWCYIISSSQADISVRTDSLIQADVDGPGNIFCYGDPDFTEYNRTGSGRLIKK